MTGYLKPLLPLVSREPGRGQGCPLLWAQVYPYVRTLALGGWFGWVQKDRNPERRESDLSRLEGPRPNSAFVNEVLVRCPNPEAELLVGIGPGASGQVVLRVLRLKGRCEFGHSVGQTMTLPASELAGGLDFSRRLPSLLEAAYAPGREGYTPCLEPRTAPEIVTQALAGPCRYHRGDEEYRTQAGWAGGMCPGAFHAVYAHALSMYYGRSDRALLEAACPAGTGSVRFALALAPRLPWPFPAAIKLTAGLASRYLHPVDPLLCRLEFRVVTAGGCSWGHAAGQVYAFNLGRQDVLCPASAYSIYPYARLSPGAREAFLGLGGWGGAICPDFMGAAYGLGDKG